MQRLLNNMALPVSAIGGASRRFAYRQSKIRNPKSKIQNPRAAFTLIELLVVMVIIVTLVTLAAGALRRSPADRINSSARQLQSRILLARSMALRDQRVTGLRLVQSVNDPWVVDTVELIASPGYDSGTATVEVNAGVWQITNESTGQWERLFQRSLIRNGSRIEIPAGTGRWYQLQGVTAANTSADFVQLVGHYTPSVWNATGSVYQPQPDPDNDGEAENIPYRLELAPTVTAGEEPLRLQPSTVIDLVASLNVPGFTSGTTTPPTASQLEILFSPGQGLAADSAAQGNIYLYITALEDVELTRNLVPDHPANGTASPVAAPIVPANLSPSAGETVVPKNEPAALTIYAQTGNVLSVPVDLTDASAPANLADDPYSFARRGKELSR